MPSSTNISPPPLKRRRLCPSPPRPSFPSISIPLPDGPPTVNSYNPLAIYSWNINGISALLPPQTTKITNFLTQSPAKRRPQPSQPSLRACLQRWKWPHFLLLQEVKINPTDTKTQAAARRAINAPLDSDDEGDMSGHLYDAHFCLPRDKFNATGFGGKVYGVCTLVRRDVKDVAVKRGNWDLEGRVLLAEIPSLGTVVINVYAVNGTTNDYRDPETGKVVGNRHDRKRAFHSLLAKEVEGYENKGWSVVVAGDINISRTKIDSFPKLRLGEDHVKNRVDFERKFVAELGMIDTFRVVHGEERKYTYRPRNKPWGAGGDRVDMVLVTMGLKKLVKDADILDNEDERGPSDHVPLFVQLGDRMTEEREGNFKAEHPP